MRIVLDTNVLARAARGGNGPASELLEQVLSSAHVLIISPFIATELSRVLRYPRMRAAHGLKNSQFDEFCQGLLFGALIVTPVQSQLVGVVAHDPNDDAVVATAIAGAADVLCTRDHHFHDGAVQSHLHAFRG